MHDGWDWTGMGGRGRTDALADLTAADAVPCMSSTLEPTALAEVSGCFQPVKCTPVDVSNRLIVLETVVN